MHWKLVVVIVAVGAVLVVGAEQLPSRPRTYRQAVAAALDERAIAYRDIQVGEPCRPNPHYCFASGRRTSYATVVVYIARPVYGRIECHAYQADCYLSLWDLHIHSVALPDLAGTRPLPRVVEYGKSWLRERIRRLRGQ